jgi:uncharacterized protein YggE
MRRSFGVATLATVVGLLLLAGAPATGQEPAPGPPWMRPPEPSVTVVGTGTVSVRPDTAEVSAGVVTQSATAAQALSENSVRVEKVLKAVTAAGIAERDVQTTNVSVVPLRRQGRQDAHPPEIVGYEVSNQVRVKVRDLGVLGRLLDALVGEGANVLGGISFSVADPAPFLDQARAKAIADARRKALVYTAAAGQRLGPLLSIRESAPAGPRFETRMLAASSVPVALGEQELQVSVTVTYGIR